MSRIYGQEGIWGMVNPIYVTDVKDDSVMGEITNFRDPVGKGDFYRKRGLRGDIDLRKFRNKSNQYPLFQAYSDLISSKKKEVEIDGKKMTYSNYVKVDVKKSNSNNNYIIIQKESKGKNKSSANSNAKKISYEYETEGNTIMLDAFYLSDFKNIWKDEEIKITFYVKENETVYFDNSTKTFLDDVKNETDIYDKDMANHYFKMTDQTLTCTDCDNEIEDDIEVETKVTPSKKVIKKAKEKVVEKTEELEEETI